MLPDGTVLVAGGYDMSIGDETASAELYDSVTGTWTTTGSMKEPLRYHSATLLPNGKVLVAGGSNFDMVTQVVARAELTIRQLECGVLPAD